MRILVCGGRGDAYYDLQMKIGREILSKRRDLMRALAKT
jgi:hypothetical protein